MKTTIALLLALLATSTAHAQSQPTTHDGFMLRLALGFGYESLSIDDGVGTELTASGFGVGSSIALGGVVARNLAINADLFASTVFSPNISENGVDLGEAQDTSVSLYGIGVGLTYWVMPLNLYLAGSVGISQATVEIQGLSFDADWGLAINAMIGKEFWVGREWGVGFAAQLLWANVPTVTDEASSSYLAFNILFSATYN